MDSCLTFILSRAGSV